MMNPWDSTERDEKYATCERTCAQLRVYFDGDWDISQMLAMDPQTSRIKGEKVRNSMGCEFGVKQSHWIYSTEGRCASLDLRDHLDLLLSLLEVNRVRLVQQIPGVKMGIYCIWWAKSMGGPVIDSDQMEKMGKLALECALDISFYGKDD